MRAGTQETLKTAHTIARNVGKHTWAGNTCYTREMQFTAHIWFNTLHVWCSYRYSIALGNEIQLFTAGWLLCMLQ